MSRSEETLKLGNATTDRVVSLAKALTGMAPVIGPIMAEIVGYVIPNQRGDRIARFVQLLDERLRELEREALEAKFTQPPVVDLLEDAFMQAARATSQERLKHIANVIVTGLSEAELNEAETKRMLWLLGQLTDAEVVILRSQLARTIEDGEQDAEFLSKHEQLLAPDFTHMGSSDEEFEQEALKASYKQHLYDLGLIRYRFRRPRPGQPPEFDHKTGMMATSGSDVTRLGKMLLRYLNLIPDWYLR